MRPLVRQVTEGVKIHNSLADIIINDKEEWIQPAVVRLQATQEAAGGRQRLRGREVDEWYGAEHLASFLSRGLLPT